MRVFTARQRERTLRLIHSWGVLPPFTLNHWPVPVPLGKPAPLLLAKIYHDGDQVYQLLVPPTLTTTFLLCLHDPLGFFPLSNVLVKARSLQPPVCYSCPRLLPEFPLDRSTTVWVHASGYTSSPFLL